MWFREEEESKHYGTCTWCNKDETIITCAGCGELIKYGDSQPSDKLKVNNKSLRICKQCKQKETTYEI